MHSLIHDFLNTNSLLVEKDRLIKKIIEIIANVGLYFSESSIASLKKKLKKIKYLDEIRKIKEEKQCFENKFHEDKYRLAVE